MLKKYIPVLNNIFEYIRNRTTVKIDVETIADEVIKRFSPEILYPDVNNECLRDIVLTLCKYAYFMYHNEAYDRL